MAHTRNAFFLALLLYAAGCDTGGGGQGPHTDTGGDGPRATPVRLDEMSRSEQARLISTNWERLRGLLGADRGRSARPTPTMIALADVDSAAASGSAPRVGALSSSAADQGVTERGTMHVTAVRSTGAGFPATNVGIVVVVNGTEAGRYGVDLGATPAEGVLLGELTLAKGDVVESYVQYVYDGYTLASPPYTVSAYQYGLYTGTWWTGLNHYLPDESGEVGATLDVEYDHFPDVDRLETMANRGLVELGSGTGFTVTPYGPDDQPVIIPDETWIEVSVSDSNAGLLQWSDPGTGTEYADFQSWRGAQYSVINEGGLGFIASETGPPAIVRRSQGSVTGVTLNAHVYATPSLAGAASFAVGFGFYEHVTKPEAEQEFKRRCGTKDPFVNPTPATYPAAFEANARLALDMVEAYVSDPDRRQLDGVSNLASGGAISDVMSAKFRDAEFTLAGDAVGVAKRDIRLLNGQYNRRRRWIFAPQLIVVSMARPENIQPIDRTDSVVPYAEARAVEVYHAPLRRVADWVSQFPSVSRYAGRYYLVAESISREVVFYWDGRFAPLPRWFSLSSSENEFTFACTTT